jgi:CHAT domain-containing protein
VTAPGLGEAFLDAGASAVVQTRWEIDDEAAHDLMASFSRRCAQGESPVAALNAVKREARDAGVAPFQWAAYSVALSRI